MPRLWKMAAKKAAWMTDETEIQQRHTGSGSAMANAANCLRLASMQPSTLDIPDRFPAVAVLSPCMNSESS